MAPEPHAASDVARSPQHDGEPRDEQDQGRDAVENAMSPSSLCVPADGWYWFVDGRGAP